MSSEEAQGLLWGLSRKVGLRKSRIIGLCFVVPQNLISALQRGPDLGRDAGRIRRDEDSILSIEGSNHVEIALISQVDERLPDALQVFRRHHRKNPLAARGRCY
jgi:hypothetical protein